MPANRDKKTGKWNCQFYYTDWTGKKVKKMKRGFETKKEAQDWERHFKLEKASSLDMTFGDFYRRYEADVKPKVRENTWQSKVWVIEKKILPYFKDLVMRDITPRDVLAWQNEMRKMESKDGNSFKGTYLRKMQAELSAIFNHAVKYYELPKNPAVIAGPLGQHHADEMLFWTKEEYMRFIPTMANKTYSYMAFEMLYWCGLRMGELLALTPADFDFDRNNVSITKSYQRIKGEDVITKPKTKKSVRVIKMPEMVAMEMQDFINSIYGIEPSDRIFVLSKSYLHHEMDRGVKASGVKRIRIHDLRHSHVSLLIDMGFSAVAIGNRVGHESAEITYRYAHMMPSIQDDMVESVKEYGVLVPAIARPRAEGGYELISGHRRKHASELAGKDTMPVIIRDCDNDEAVVIMVDANIQREDILISERAKAYQMKYEAMKRSFLQRDPLVLLPHREWLCGD